MQVSVLSFNCASVRHLFSVYKCLSSLSRVQVSVFSFLCTSVRLLFLMYTCPSSLSYVQVSVFSFTRVPSSQCTNVRLLFLIYTCQSSLSYVQMSHLLFSYLHVSVFSFMRTRVCLLSPAYSFPSSLSCVQMFLSFTPIQPAALIGRLITYTSVFMNSCVYSKSVRNHV